MLVLTLLMTNILYRHIFYILTYKANNNPSNFKNVCQHTISILTYYTHITLSNIKYSTFYNKITLLF